MASIGTTENMDNVNNKNVFEEEWEEGRTTSKNSGTGVKVRKLNKRRSQTEDKLQWFIDKNIPAPPAPPVASLEPEWYDEGDIFNTNPNIFQWGQKSLSKQDMAGSQFMKRRWSTSIILPSLVSNASYDNDIT